MANRSAKILTNLLLSFLLGSIALVLLFRFVPVPFTPLMLKRHIEAHQQGRHLEIQHQWIPLEDISPNLIAAVIDHEDAKFYDHCGFDWDAISYAYEQNQRYGRIVCGGSTISQQTAKNIFTFPLDLACADAVNAQTINPGSRLASANRPDLDNLTAPFPHTSWRAQIQHAKKIGLGEDTYELVNIG